MPKKEASKDKTESKDKSAFEIGVDAALNLLKALFTSEDKRKPGEKLVDNIKEVKTECEKVSQK